MLVGDELAGLLLFTQVEPKKEAVPAEPTAEATGAPKPDDTAMPEGEGASVPSKVDIEEVTDTSAPMEEER